VTGHPAETPPTTRQLAGALLAIALLALVVPPVMASRLNAARVERAREGVAHLAMLVASRDVVADAQERLLTTGGSRPVVAADGWDLASARPLDAAGGTAPDGDPWGNRYIVWLSGRDGARGFVLSAGPNGQINTDLRDGRVTPAGDDLIAWID
jgi:hypothetical protein